MEMTDFEIFKNWKESKNPSTQVKILAELNGCKPAEITDIIRKVEATQTQKQSAEPVPAEPVPAEPIQSEDKLTAVYPLGYEPITEPTDKPTRDKSLEPVPAESAESAPTADDLDKRLIELYNAGATYKEIAAAQPVSMNTIKTHVMKLTASGEITYRRPRKSPEANARETHEPEPERTENAPVTIPADDMIQWLEALKACTDIVEGGAKITHICANDGEQAEVGFTADGKGYLLRVEVRRD